MAQVLMVVYELDKEPTSKEYQEIVKIIKNYEYLKIGGSEYCIYTNDSPQIVIDKIKPHLDQGDKLLVIRITNPKQGWLSEDEWKWLNDRL